MSKQSFILSFRKFSGIKINNILTLLRIVFTPIAAILISTYESKVVGLTLFVILALTDLLDGYLARKLKTESMIGKILDPVADKCMAFIMLFMLAFMQKFNLICLLCSFIIITREMLILALRGMNNDSQIRAALQSTQLSKYKTAFINIAIILFLLNIACDSFSIIFGQSCLVIAATLTLLSIVKPAKILYQLLKKEK